MNILSWLTWLLSGTADVFQGISSAEIKMSMNNHMTEITKVLNSTGIDLECRRLFLLHFAIRPFFKRLSKNETGWKLLSEEQTTIF